MTRSCGTLDVRYRLEERIAAGGVGQVWRGTDLLLQRPIAIKVLRPEYARHRETLERFRAEARHAGALNHPCVAQVYDYRDGGPDASPYLVMELVDGPSLADILGTGTVDVARAMDIVAQAAAGLAIAHRAGLVHRDIKPANILLSPDGLVKVTDFGIAYAAGSAPITAPELVMGTAQYMSPERVSGAPYGPASDLYSLGIVLYECLAGQMPFDGTAAEVMSAHLHAPLPPLPPGIPPAIRDLLARLTAKDPAARLADAAELATTARRLSLALTAVPPQPPAEPASRAQPDSQQELVPGAEPAKMTRTEAQPTRTRRRGVLAAAATTAMLAVFCAGLASGAIQITTMPGQAVPGATTHRRTPPAKATAPGTRPVVTPSDSAGGVSRQPSAPSSPRPTPSPGPGGNAGHGRSRTGGTKNARRGGGSGPSTVSTPNQTATSSPDSGSAGSGGGIQVQVPVLGISLGL
jgi:serine/threonine-protein kinase